MTGAKSAPAMSPDGQRNISAIKGFVGLLIDLMDLQPPPTHMALVLDAHGVTFRQALTLRNSSQGSGCMPMGSDDLQPPPTHMVLELDAHVAFNQPRIPT